MTVATKFGLGPVSVGGTVIPAVTRSNLVLGAEVRGEATAGEIYNRWQALYAQKQAPGFSAHGVATALDNCGYTGVSLAVDNLVAYLTAHALGGSRAIGANQRSYTWAKGILAPASLTCNHGEDAEISYQAVTVSADGSTSPLSISTTATLPAITDAERFTLGTCTLESQAIAGKLGVEFSFGVDLVGEAADSDLYDTFASIREINSVLTIRGIDMTWIDSKIPVAGLNVTHANTAIYLRKRAAGGAFVADITAEHIKITAAGLAVIDSVYDAAGNDTGTCSLTMPLVYDGTNAPFTVDTSSAIT